MVEYRDGAVIAQLGTPDMKLPIQYALFYPERRFLAGDRLDFATLTAINIEKPDTDTFLGLPYAYEAIEAGGSMPTVFNAANEKAVGMFLDNKIQFLDIYRIIRECMDNHKVVDNPDIDEILDIEQGVYESIDSKSWH
jgi:1-deoxy-D-xylulose-5-phosphate reductoisomerase